MIMVKGRGKQKTSGRDQDGDIPFGRKACVTMELNEFWKDSFGLIVLELI